MSRNEQIMTEELARAIKLEPEDINDFKKYVQGEETYPQKNNQIKGEPYKNNVTGLAEFLSELRAPCYVWQGIIQKNQLYAITANPGSGKTAISLALALAMTQQLPVHKRKTMQSKVLYLCGENPDDVRLRFKSLMIEYGVSQDDVNGKIFFTKRPFHIDNETVCKQFLAEASIHAPVLSKYS